jgi:hypothetical protein
MYQSMLILMFKSLSKIGLLKTQSVMIIEKQLSMDVLQVQQMIIFGVILQGCLRIRNIQVVIYQRLGYRRVDILITH